MSDQNAEQKRLRRQRHLQQMSKEHLVAEVNNLEAQAIDVAAQLKQVEQILTRLGEFVAFLEGQQAEHTYSQGEAEIILSLLEVLRELPREPFWRRYGLDTSERFYQKLLKQMRTDEIK